MKKAVFIYFLALTLLTNNIFLETSKKKYSVVNDPKSTQEFNEIVKNSDLTIVFGKNSKEELNRNVQKSAFSFYSKNQNINVSLVFFNNFKSEVAKTMNLAENKIIFYKNELFKAESNNKKSESKPTKINDKTFHENDLINPKKCICKIADLASQYFLAINSNGKVDKTTLEKIKHTKSISKKTAKR